MELITPHKPVGWVGAQRKPSDAGNSLGFVPQPSLMRTACDSPNGGRRSGAGPDSPIHQVQFILRRQEPVAVAVEDQLAGQRRGAVARALGGDDLVGVGLPGADGGAGGARNDIGAVPPGDAGALVLGCGDQGPCAPVPLI